MADTNSNREQLRLAAAQEHVYASEQLDQTAVQNLHMLQDLPDPETSMDCTHLINDSELFRISEKQTDTQNRRPGTPRADAATPVKRAQFADDHDQTKITFQSQLGQPKRAKMRLHKKYEEQVDEPVLEAVNYKMQKYESQVKYINLDKTVDKTLDKTVNRTFGEAEEPQNEEDNLQPSNTDSVMRIDQEAQSSQIQIQQTPEIKREAEKLAKVSKDEIIKRLYRYIMITLPKAAAPSILNEIFQGNAEEIEYVQKIGGDLGQGGQYFGDLMAQQEQYAKRINDEVGESKQEYEESDGYQNANSINQLGPAARGRSRRVVSMHGMEAGAPASVQAERKDSSLNTAQLENKDKDPQNRYTIKDHINDIEEESKQRQSYSPVRASTIQKKYFESVPNDQGYDQHLEKVRLEELKKQQDGNEQKTEAKRKWSPVIEARSSASTSIPSPVRQSKRSRNEQVKAAEITVTLRSGKKQPQKKKEDEDDELQTERHTLESLVNNNYFRTPDFRRGSPRSVRQGSPFRPNANHSLNVRDPSPSKAARNDRFDAAGINERLGPGKQNQYEGQTPGQTPLPTPGDDYSVDLSCMQTDMSNLTATRWNFRQNANDDLFRPLILAQLFTYGSRRDRLRMARYMLESKRALTAQKPSELETLRQLSEKITMQLDQYVPGRDAELAVRPGMQQAEPALSYAPEFAPDLRILLKILGIEDDGVTGTKVEPRRQRPKKTLGSPSPKYDRIMLIGCDNSTVDHQKSRNCEPQYLQPTPLAINYSSTPTDEDSSSYVNDFICETFGRRLIYEVLPSLPLAAQLIMKKLESALAGMTETLKGDGPEGAVRRSQMNNKKTGRDNRRDWKLQKMLYDLEVPDSECYCLRLADQIPDYQLINEDGKYHMALTEVSIVMRFEAQASQVDEIIAEKSKQMQALKMTYLQNRAENLRKLLVKIQNHCRANMLDEALSQHDEDHMPATASADFQAICMLALEEYASQLRRDNHEAIEALRLFNGGPGGGREASPSPTANRWIEQAPDDADFFGEFSLKGLLQLSVCLMQQKKVVVVSDSCSQLSRSLAAIASRVLQPLGFHWPHLQASFLPIASGNAAAWCSQLLLAPLPGLIALLREDFEQLLPLLRAEKESFRQGRRYQSPWTARAASHQTVAMEDICLVNADTGAVFLGESPAQIPLCIAQLYSPADFRRLSASTCTKDCSSFIADFKSKLQEQIYSNSPLLLRTKLNGRSWTNTTHRIRDVNTAPEYETYKTICKEILTNASRRYTGQDDKEFLTTFLKSQLFEVFVSLKGEN